MRIKDRVEYKNKSPVMTFEANDMVISAVKAMSDKNYGAAVIVDKEHKPIGIITERDFMRRLLAKGLDPNSTEISQIMTSDLKLANEEDEVIDWLRIMSNERFRHLPIVNEAGKVTNLMSQGDFVSYTWPQLIGKLKDTAIKSFMDRFHLHIIVGGIMFYTVIMIFIMRKL